MNDSVINVLIEECGRYERTGIAMTGASAVPFAKSFCETLRIPLAIPERTRINKDDKESFVVLVIIGAHHAYGNE